MQQPAGACNYSGGMCQKADSRNYGVRMGMYGVTGTYFAHPAKIIYAVKIGDRWKRPLGLLRIIERLS